MPLHAVSSYNRILFSYKIDVYTMFMTFIKYYKKEMSCNGNTNSKIKLVHLWHFMFIFEIFFYLNIKYILSLSVSPWFVEMVIGNNISKHVEIWNTWTNFLQFLSFRENMYNHNLQDITVYTPGTLRSITASKHLKRFRKI